jgi:eukaryotic-like serine/threonine-protein kinase
MVDDRMVGEGSARSVSSANRAGIFAEGSRFGAYVLGPCIGYGESGRLYRAEHEAIHSPLALKVFTDDFARSTAGRNRFLREARRAATVRHPSLVNIFDLGVQDGIPYLVMELLDGESLDALLRSRGALDESAIVDVMVPIVAGLAALHEVGIVHGDLKTKNVFLVYRSSREREPKLLDFGASRPTEGDKLRGASGTRGIFRESSTYMSPEAARGADLTAASDQYSLGVVLYECAVGLNPFVAETGKEAIRRIISGEYPPLSRHEARPSELLVRIVERAMSLEPSHRYPDLKALGRDLLMLASERTRMTWTLSFGQAQGAHGASLGAGSHLASLRYELRLLFGSLSRGTDWTTLGALVLGIVSFGWALAIWLSR